MQGVASFILQFAIPSALTPRVARSLGCARDNRLWGRLYFKPGFSLRVFAFICAKNAFDF